MAESIKPRGNQLCSGTFGKLWIDGMLAYEVYKFEAKEKTNRESVSFAGDTTNDSKLMGVDYEFSYTVRKVYSRGKAIADGHKKGQDTRHTLVARLEDPENGGYETIQLDNCWYNDVSLMNFENGKIVEEEFSGGFTDHDLTTTMNA